jgi:SET domain-containing protein
LEVQNFSIFQDPNMPKLCLFALRDVIKGEELTFDYKQQTGPMSPKKVSSKPKNSGTIEVEKTECRCGTSVCRKVVF